MNCSGRITVHHCFTGGGGRKDHDKTIPLCHSHHLGPEGIDGKRMSKRAWQEKYGSEASLMVKTQDLLDKKAGRHTIIWIDEAAAIPNSAIDTLLRLERERKQNV